LPGRCWPVSWSTLGEREHAGRGSVLFLRRQRPRGVVVNVATQDDDETVSFRAMRFDRARGATICALNLPDELALHASAASDLARLCALAADGRLDDQAVLECSWRQPGLRSTHC
jgi:hypothetical protein